MFSTRALLSQSNVFNKVWSTTIKIPELKTTAPALASSFDNVEVSSQVMSMLKDYKGKVLIITGAGVSTDSGIPDYRGDQGTYVTNPKHRPILYQELMSSHDYRQRYWSRSYLGWQKMSCAQPNPSHFALASLLKSNNEQGATPYLQGIITQNVDYLHTKASTPADKLLELHGTLYKVECMDCTTAVDREAYQHRIHARNPQWQKFIGTSKINPDGDVELPAGLSFKEFDIPPCSSCGSVKMKPKVVFFGENIRPEITHQAERWIHNAGAILVIGSSLATYSSFRLVRLGHQLGKPIGIITKGPTRADHLMQWKGEVGCTEVLTNVCSQLT